MNLPPPVELRHTVPGARATRGYPGDVTERRDPRRMPFGVAAAVLLIVSVAVFRLPQALVADMQRDGLLTGDAADVAFVLFAAAAVAQAVYAGFVLLRPERVETALAADARLATAPRAVALTSVAWNAAGIASLTLVYGVAAFALTGLRGGFWLFAVLELLQGAWYFRQVGTVGARLSDGAARP
jgi:hypothetical protein